MRGPLLYCLEACDNGADLNALSLPADAGLGAEWRADLLGGVMVIRGEAQRDQSEDWGETLYRAEGSGTERVAMTAVPYYAWANRGKGEMVVWVRE